MTRCAHPSWTPLKTCQKDSYCELISVFVLLAYWRCRLDEFERAIAAMRVTIDSALADVAHAWNERNMDPLRRLPAELHVLCLQWLQVHELIAASHVSRHWRAIALSEPTLWDSYDIAPFKDVEQSLDAVLCRSRPVPFDLTWGGPINVSPRLGELLVASAARFRHVHFRLHSQKIEDLNLLDRVMPQLRTLDVENVRYHVQLPDSISDYTMPRLLSLKLGPTVLPTRIQAVSSITSLKLQVPPDSRRLFLLFPCVQKAILHRVSSTTLLPPELPQSLSSMMIFSDSGLEQDHSEQLRSLGWRLVPHLRLESTDILRPLIWFTASATESLSMIISYCPNPTFTVEMTVNAEDQATLSVSVRYGNFCGNTFWDRQGHWTATLTKLTVRGLSRLLPTLVAQIQALPSLQSLTLRLIANWDMPTGSLRSQDCSIAVPVLLDLVLDYDSLAELDAQDMIGFVQTVTLILSLGDRRLEKLSLVGPGIAQLRHTDMSFLSPFCETLRLEDGDFEESRRFSRLE